MHRTVRAGARAQGRLESMSAATVRIGAVELGSGRPKVGVPLTGATVEALAAEAGSIDPGVADLVELRIDRLAAADAVEVARAIDAVRAALDPALPILFTCRTRTEGGGADLGESAHRALLLAAVAHEGVDAVDVEMALPEAVVAAVVTAADAAGVPVVMSFHDLAGTPSRAGILGRLRAQQDLGADLVKLACTPATPADVLTLLAATHEYASGVDSRPAITMAMGPLGVVSRLAGETFGSVLTFGAVGAASAPGQLDAVRLREALDLIHEAQTA